MYLCRWKELSSRFWEGEGPAALLLWKREGKKVQRRSQIKMFCGGRKSFGMVVGVTVLCGLAISLQIRSCCGILIILGLAILSFRFLVSLTYIFSPSNPSYSYSLLHSYSYQLLLTYSSSYSSLHPSNYYPIDPHINPHCRQYYPNPKNFYINFCHIIYKICN